MSQPQDFETKNKTDYACNLEKSLYGRKQSPIESYRMFDTYVLKIGFKSSDFDACLYYNKIKVGVKSTYFLCR